MVAETRAIDPGHEVRAHGVVIPQPWHEACASGGRQLGHVDVVEQHADLLGPLPGRQPRLRLRRLPRPGPERTLVERGDLRRHGEGRGHVEEAVRAGGADRPALADPRRRRLRLHVLAVPPRVSELRVPRVQPRRPRRQADAAPGSGQQGDRAHRGDEGAPAGRLRPRPGRDPLPRPVPGAVRPQRRGAALQLGPHRGVDGVVAERDRRGPRNPP